MSYPITAFSNMNYNNSQTITDIKDSIRIPSFIIKTNKKTQKHIVKKEFNRLLKAHPSLGKTSTKAEKAYVIWLAMVVNNKTDEISNNFINEYSNFNKGNKIEGCEIWHGKTGNQILAECVEKAFSDNYPLTEGILWHSFLQIYGESQYYKNPLYLHEKINNLTECFDMFIL